MSRYFILGQIAALNYFKAIIKPSRMDQKNIYIKSISYIARELDKLYDMLIDEEMRYRVWNGGYKWTNKMN